MSDQNVTGFEKHFAFVRSLREALNYLDFSTANPSALSLEEELNSIFDNLFDSLDD